MNVDLNLYRIFYTVAKYKHMTKASEELFISQPAISQAIKKLEEQLGDVLFLRSNKGMELTEEGKMMFEYVKSALELIGNAENEFTSFKELKTGTIKIGCSTTLTKLLLLDFINAFHKDFPNIEIMIKNELTSNLLLDLQKGKLDFVIFNEGDVKESNVTLERIGTLKQGFIYHADYYKDKWNSLEKLREVPLILQNKDSNSRKFLDAYTLKQNILLKPKMEAVSQELVIEFVNTGLGIGFTILELAKKKYPYLKELKINESIPSTEIYLALNKNVATTFASKKFLSYLKK